MDPDNKEGEHDGGLEGLFSPTASDYETPIRSKRVYQATMTQQPTVNVARVDVEETVKVIRTKDYLSISKIAERDHLTDDNWHEWKERSKRVFLLCKISGYVNRTLKRPNELTDPDGANNWDENDCWAQQVIIQNVAASQMNHVGSMASSATMYHALSVTHENKAYGTVHHVQCLLHETKAGEGDNILKHLDILKSYHDRINKFPHPDFHVSNVRFKSIISESLPSTWRTYVEPYNGNADDPNNPDPK
jgi:hypothetical protein